MTKYYQIRLKNSNDKKARWMLILNRNSYKQGKNLNFLTVVFL